MRLRKLQEELQQTKPFSSKQEEAMLAIMKTADVVRRRVAAIIEPFGVTMQQYNVLRILRGAGPRGLPTLSIGQRLIEATPGVTRLLDRMEARGWVLRLRCDQDRRVVYAIITHEGLELLAAIDPPLEHYNHAALPLLSATQLDALVGLLELARAEDE
ncbi:MAG: MarR family transcriptional regulator [Bryobacterales bacterium]|jgi:DNA-binding MarR family transcriptional regulator|nr:MarR family transcriptional regulator [Bryobacterales bacterium]